MLGVGFLTFNVLICIKAVPIIFKNSVKIEGSIRNILFTISVLRVWIAIGHFFYEKQALKRIIVGIQNMFKVWSQTGYCFNSKQMVIYHKSLNSSFYYHGYHDLYHKKINWEKNYLKKVKYMLKYTYLYSIIYNNLKSFIKNFRGSAKLDGPGLVLICVISFFPIVATNSGKRFG